MTVTTAVMAIARYNQIIRDCERRLDAVHPAFLHDYDEIDLAEHNLCEALACRDMLTDWLIGIGGDDG